MNGSASPKAAIGPVRGLTWPILMTRDWALAGSTRSTAGAAMAPRPAVTTRRRLIDRCFMATSLADALGVTAGHSPSKDGRKRPYVPAVSIRRAQSDHNAMAGTSRTSPAMTKWKVLHIVGARLLEMLHHLGAERGLRLRGPLAKTFARFEAELALRHKPFEIGRRRRPRIDRRQDGLVNGEREISPDQV